MLNAARPPTDPMLHALALAEGAIGLSEPNPRVGCVLVAADGRWIGEGHTQAAGSAHAEVMALRDAQARGHDPRGATAYVTLEPCSHHGRTPPCCDALVTAGVGRVVVAAGDPNPRVNGQGIARLRAAGIVVEWAGDAAADTSRELNIGFFSRMQRGRPWVRMKIAASLDGRTALDNGTSQWITGEAARHDGHAWRRRAAALLTGSGTVLADDPRLDVRGHAIARQPLRVVADSRLATPADARLFEAAAPLLIATAQPDGERAAALRARGAEILPCPGAGGRVDLDVLLRELAHREMNEVHVEAGARLNAALLQAGWVDELLVYQAPLLIGAGRGMAALGPLTALADAQRFAFHRVDRVGGDLRLLLRRPAA
ncbi:bifunctional diaminohydroxyphosphoribosylaminopyrimidine deaminase/5-amino-6-(5-phosphoribosylamino)uracil reductase RibD [Ideonella sp.]|uniref:bifunctional diaminohydroxyphosphoribosylaminopyrimidine deaminase/5-amino-6-(5-phosphoribosylamino)uracil reductase RibD n=1 Tax=Ideonella sp. TaxID=1929293 RepID=UPI002B45B0FF|nr:bifunctional diaminohydroxyphosphoribosylaminopyrimidine deaminase/5-amino-6-(5-phosphoribosylamino)uracil reductase RibD [Ideonella sp.]HJV70795.1 bifunctional diaminohydroxyphosphoribosylaminopyrimidine deaminase/5-amino-6-(5-phosphoribosylamino)uracil reductase RibD [Ideonella sp.]